MAGRDTSYDARVRIEDFNLGHLLKMDSTLGILAFDADVKGHGLNPKTMQADVKGKLLRLDAMGYRYQNIDLDLTGKQRRYRRHDQQQRSESGSSYEMLNADMRGKYPKMICAIMVRSLPDFETADLNFLNGPVLTLSFVYRLQQMNRFVLDSVSMIAKADTSRNMLTLQSEFLKAHLVDKFYFGRDTVGNIAIKVNNEKENTYAADVSITENGNNIRLLGEYISPPDGKSTFQATLDLKPLKMKTVDVLQSGYAFQNYRRNLEGNTQYQCTTADPSIKGDLVFQGCTVEYHHAYAD
ncbi:hypothetical protein FQR65_LT19283 [Abscondita terminalis]|nr:hypothetical protein FQR65_LT19283 [Abscondita terminalis]